MKYVKYGFTEHAKKIREQLCAVLTDRENVSAGTATTATEGQKKTHGLNRKTGKQ